MVASTDPGWIQTAFGMMPGIFEQVSLQTNIRKTVGMVCQPCRAVRVRADEAYKRRVMIEGRSYHERQGERVQCPGCGKDLVKGSLSIHHQTQHGVARGGAGKKDDDGDGNGGDKTRTFRMKSPKKAGPKPCPFEGCSNRAETRTSMWVHLWHRHVRDTMVILEEGTPSPNHGDLCATCW